MKNYRRDSQAKVSLVSLMDIFTVLVFFLMFSSDPETEAFVEAGGVVSLPTYSSTGNVVDNLLPVITLNQISEVSFDSSLFKSGSADDESETIENFVFTVDDFAIQLEDMTLINNTLTLKADQNLKYVDVKRLIDLLESKGASNLELLTVSQEGGR